MLLQTAWPCIPGLLAECMLVFMPLMHLEQIVSDASFDIFQRLLRFLQAATSQSHVFIIQVNAERVLNGLCFSRYSLPCQGSRSQPCLSL